jgi:hypothetical protein
MNVPTGQQPTAYPAGLVSADGNWVWDGSQWRPRTQAYPSPAKRSGQNWWLTSGIALASLLVGGVCGVAVGAANSHPTPQPVSQAAPSALAATTSPGPTASPAPTRATFAPVTVQAAGASKSAPFDLTAGNYSIAYDFGGNCAYFAYLKSTDGTYNNIDFASGSGPIKGTTHLYGLKSGAYYIDFNTGPPPDCPWSLTFTLA